MFINVPVFNLHEEGDYSGLTSAKIAASDLQDCKMVGCKPDIEECGSAEEMLEFLTESQGS